MSFHEQHRCNQSDEQTQADETYRTTSGQTRNTMHKHKSRTIRLPREEGKKRGKNLAAADAHDGRKQFGAFLGHLLQVLGQRVL